MQPKAMEIFCSLLRCRRYSPDRGSNNNTLTYHPNNIEDSLNITNNNNLSGGSSSNYNSNNNNNSNLSALGIPSNLNNFAGIFKQSLAEFDDATLEEILRNPTSTGSSRPVSMANPLGTAYSPNSFHLNAQRSKSRGSFTFNPFYRSQRSASNYEEDMMKELS
jgi:hypothetical protein